MTSLTGASGEDFASILRSLGYRMDRKPKPPEPANPAKAAPAPRLRRPHADPAAAGAVPTAEVAAIEPETIPAIEAPVTEPAAEAPQVELASSEPAPAEIPAAAAPEVLPESKSEETTCFRRTSCRQKFGRSAICRRLRPLRPSRK